MIARDFHAIRPGSPAAFSLIEVVVAIGICAVTVISVLESSSAP